MLGIALKRWNWLERGVLPLAAALTDSAWAYPLFALFVRNPVLNQEASGFTFWLALGILIAGAAAGALASQNRMGAVIVVVGGFAAIYISLLVTFPTGSGSLDLWWADIGDRVANGRPGEIIPLPVLVVLFAGFLWWRGVRIVSAAHGETAGSFVVGVIALAGLLALSVVLPAAQLAPESFPVRDINSGAGMAPILFLLSLPTAVVFAVLSRYIGERAVTISQGAVVAGLLFLGGAMPYGPDSAGLIGWVLLFVACGLVTLSLNGVSDTLEEQQSRVGVRLRIDRYWVVAMLSVVATVMVLGVLIGQILVPEMVLRMFAWVPPVWDWILRAILFIIAVFAYLFFSLLEPLLAGIEDRPRETAPRPFFSPIEPNDLEQLAREPLQIPPLLLRIVQIGLLVGGVALVGYVFWVAIRRLGAKAVVRQGEVVETRETILSIDLLRDQVGGLLDSLRRARGSPPFLEPGPAGDPRRIIRELYQKVLSRGIELNLPRKRAQTPNAYQQSLSYLCPDEQVSVRVLTQAYVTARYSVEPPTGEQVRAAEAAFARIDEALQAKVRERKLGL